ncbi:MAG: histidinol-phosphatase [Ekhidna sp.]|uniref:histidinol-phosphatase n=1 Tax=Ekhidna sp. TaxID=2608089 RepID=UPI0032EAD454
MQPILFIDRDGTIIQETDDEKIETIEKLDFLPEALYYLKKIKEETNFLFVMVTNQDGLGTVAFPEHEFWPVQNFIMRLLESEGIHFDAVHIDEHYERDNHPNRKPGTGMLTKYMKGDYDLENSYVIGDRATDVQLARNLGCKAIYLTSAYSDAETQAELKPKNWKEIYEFLVARNS